MAMLFYWRAHEVILQSPLVEQRNIMGLKFAFCEREGETLRFLDAGLVFFCFAFWQTRKRKLNTTCRNELKSYSCWVSKLLEKHRSQTKFCAFPQHKRLADLASWRPPAMEFRIHLRFVSFSGQITVGVDPSDPCRIQKQRSSRSFFVKVSTGCISGLTIKSQFRVF